MQRVRYLLCVFILAAAASAAAQLSLSAPPDRVVLPGDFVTLVFRATSDVDAQADVTLTTTPELQAIGSADSVSLDAGVATPIAVTVRIPDDLPALTLVTARLALFHGGDSATSSVQLTIGERRGVTLSAPPQVLLSAGSFDATLKNVGNVEMKVSLDATQGDVSLASLSPTVDAGAAFTVPITVAQLGSVRITVTGDGIEPQEARVRVVREGVPPPPALVLHGTAGLALNSALQVSGSMKVEGPLSDYVDLDMEFNAPTLTTSHLRLRSRAWTVRLLDLGEAPYGLRLPGGVGVRGTLDVGPLDLGAAAAWTGADTFATYVLLGDQTHDERWGVAAGLSAAEPVLGAHYDRRSPGWSVRGDGRLDAGRLDLTLTSVQNDATHDGDLTFVLAGQRLLDPDGRLAMSTGYTDRDLNIYGRLEAPFGPGAVWEPGAGLSLRLPLELPGSLFVQGSTDPGSQAMGVIYAASLGSGWQTSNKVGARWTDAGMSLQAGTSWNFLAGAGNGFGSDLALTYVLSSDRLEGDAKVRYARTVDDVKVEAEGAWDMGDGSLGLTGRVVKDLGALTLGLDTSFGKDAGGAFAASFTLGALYAFDLVTPAVVVSAAGGRRLGVLQGQVGVHPESSVAAGGLPGVVIRIDGATLHTDANGHYVAEVAPGKHKVALEPASVPIAYRFDGPIEHEVEVAAKDIVTTDFPVVAASALSGQVLLDTDGDGVPDDPPAAGQGRVRVTPSDGPVRLLDLDTGGRFELRGLAPGSAIVELVGTAVGATIIGPKELTATLRPGQVSTVTLLVRPASAVAPTFASASLRVRRIAFEVDRVPPGSAPLVEVTVQGDADSVTVATDGRTVALEPHDDVWAGRVPILDASREGLLEVLVTASEGGTVAKRKATLIIDASTPVVQLDSPPAVRAGGVSMVSLVVYDEASSVNITPPFGPALAATESSPGRWTATVPVPAGTADAIYEILVEVERTHGRSVSDIVRLRVLGP